MVKSSADLVTALEALSIPARKEHNPKFFKSGKGEYAEGDLFIGNKVPDMRAVAKDFYPNMSDAEMIKSLHSKWHEVRLTAVFILIHKYKKARKDQTRREELIQIYLNNLEGINNWDLVDSSAPYLLGDWLLDRDRAILREFALEEDLWKNRIAMVSTYWFIKNKQYGDTLELAEVLLFHEHDLIHKAVGWMLREMGNREPVLLRQFLEHHAHHMPRTALRYSIEKLDKEERTHWMTAKDRQ
ncbi:DNA alkylation repair protein [Phaeocystidibacter luteus]|uniref:DNA alkylation repair protein n=1 Tax=Phaeocystidibacter luteus TaxID=911197 RepID=UPI001CB8AC79|nr:DNA alkylation repair protein [Phaeocystidibacter luteus]